jgi:hypothetical protein
MSDERLALILANVFNRLGLGHLRVSQVGLEDALEQAYRRIDQILNENRRQAGEMRELRRAQPAPVVEYRNIVVDSHPAAHDHHVQFKILDTEDRVLDASEWVLSSGANALEAQYRTKMLDLQMDGRDVFLRRYNRCNHVNLTVQVDREEIP